MSGTHKLKIVAADGKKYNSDALLAEDIVILAKHYPNNRAAAFLDWFTYSDNTLDGQSRKKPISPTIAVCYAGWNQAP